MSRARPTASGTSTLACATPPLVAPMMPKTTSVSPAVASPAPHQSMVGRSRPMRTSGTRASAIASVTSASGTSRKNAARQEAASTSAPPRIGPPAPVSAVKADQVPMARPRVDFGNAALSSARLFGTSSAPPNPCTARATMRSVPFLAMPAPADASARIASPITNSRRRPKRSPSDPAARVRAASSSV